MKAKGILNASFVQFDIKWEDPASNLKKLDNLLNINAANIDLLVLPEMFNTGFTMNASAVAEPSLGPTFQWMCHVAVSRNMAVCGSIVVEDGGKFYNRFYFVHPDGSFEYYNKRHLFTLAGEHMVYEPGQDLLVVDYMGWKICLMVCYDLRFPGLLRSALPFDLVLYVASWPAKRIAHWSALLKARAIENQAYVLGVNRVGEDANHIYYNGASTCIDPLGEELVVCRNTEGLFTVPLLKNHLNEVREKLPFLTDRDKITIG